MARPSSKDPLDKFRWLVSIDGFQYAGFTTTESPGIAINTKEYAEGGNHLNPKQIIDSANFKPIALSRGVAVTDNLDFITWVQAATNITSDGLLSSRRRNIIISHTDRNGDTVRKYTLINAIPIELHVSSDFSADADDTYSIERLVLKYEGFTVETANSSQYSLRKDITDITKQLTRKIF